MSAEAARFDRSADPFDEYSQQVRGYVRYSLVQRNLETFLEYENLNVLDVQGGAGLDADWLATAAHNVTLLEESPEQLEKARARFAILPDTAWQRINIVEGGFSALPDGASFDVVLCHGVAMYQEQSEAFLAEVCSYAKPNGVVSVLEKGFGGIKRRLEDSEEASEQDQTKDMDRLENEQRFTNTLGHDVYAFHPGQLIACLARAGVDTVDWFGVRVDTDQDKRLVCDLSKEALTEILATEHHNSIDPVKKQLGHMLHLIGVKR